MRPSGPIAAALDGQRGHLFLWVPVLFGSGIGVYFGLPHDPAPALWWAVLAVALAAAALVFRGGEAWRPAGLGLLAVLCGFAAATARTHAVAEPALGWRYYGPVEGRVVAIDRSASDALRLTLDRVVLHDVAPARTPSRVRVSLHGTQARDTFLPGEVIGMTAHLSPPGGPVEPGGFDFRRHAWFQGLGAVGYTRTPVVLFEPPGKGGAALRLYAFRMSLSRAIREQLPGRAGAFASAIVTGDRSELDGDTLEALRVSNLAHLLAISGLHMGLLTGFVFGAVRLGLALTPRAALLWPAKRIAALAALVAGAAYLAISGGSVATERAYVMVAVMFVAVLLGRRAITLRAVALAALVVLALRPEALLGPGFQMSFAATTALVAVYGALREDGGGLPRDWPFWARLVAGVALSSLVAGLATAPYAAAHFNRMPHYGLLANIVSVPLMGALVVPGAVLAACLAPFGLGWVGLRLMEPAILWILGVAETVAGWPGAVSHVVAPAPAVLPLLTFGALFLVIWQGRLRFAGLPVAAAALLLWAGSERPAALIAETGGLVGVMGPEGRALSKPRGDGFAATAWLENDGDGAGQVDAAARSGLVETGPGRLFEVGGARILHATGKRRGAEAVGLCRTVDLVVTNAAIDAPEGCRLLDARALRRTGAVALHSDGRALRLVPSRPPGRGRPWSQ